METYNGTINEYVDWVTGENSLTGGNDTGGKSVSGASIRELLQNRLKNPITIYRDKQAKLYRIFSSEASKNLWQSDPVKNANLELANFVAPSEYSIDIKIINGETIRYIRDGVQGQQGSVLTYEWSVTNDKGNEYDENLYVIYKIKETDKQYPFTIKSTDKTVSIDLFDYLISGINTITIEARGAVSGATAVKEITINTLTLNIRTDIQTYNVYSLNQPLSFGLYAERNQSGPLTFLAKRYYYGAKKFNTGAQESIESEIPISIVDQNNLSPNVTYQETGTPILQTGLHTVQVVGRMDIENQAFYSNMLYYLIGVNKTIGDIVSDDAITISYEYNDTHDFISDNGFIIPLTQYETTQIDWNYIRLSADNKTKTIQWYLQHINTQDENDFQQTYLNEFEVTSGQQAPKLVFSPAYATEAGYDDFLVAVTGNKELIKIPVHIEQSELAIGETGGINLKLKLSAFGRSNDNASKDIWTYNSSGTIYSTIFTGFTWNQAIGWYENSLRLNGIGSYATINYNPFGSLDMEHNGLTVEVEFESEFVSSTTDPLIVFGGNSGTRIVIYPNKAILYVNNSELISTNYKTNERVKLAFIVEPSGVVSDELQKVAFIVNNGICERSAGWKDIQETSFSRSSGNIKIGGSNSGVRLYSIRCYNAAITILNAYNNYVFDSDDKAQIIYNNNIYDNGIIDIEKCKNKIDIIKIDGNLTNILARNTLKEDSNSTCNIERICVQDPSKNFKVTNGRIRKHGQSTLNYPLTSYKIWLNQSADDNIEPSMLIDEDPELPFTKNRYQMKTNAIPSNKFVLQANYADSSGVHNGGLLRLIQDTWYNALFPDGEYKLRTAPQLFMSNKTISKQEGDTTPNNSNADLIFRGYNYEGKQWKDYFGDVQSPYIVRNAPDSFPCLVFYKNTDAGDTTYTLLGQYVFMDDKKSDFVYGQRSIYYAKDTSTGANNANDPFCVKLNQTTGKSLWDEKADTTKKIWDNENVLRIEVLSVNSTLADYRGYVADNSHRRFDNFVQGTDENSTSLGWEEDFELVYPDKEDITTSKRFDPIKYRNTVKPFTDWLQWIIDTKNNYSEMGYNSAQAAFEATAASHLDLYKIAAYYIFVLRFGLVDSLERNVQIKTYDGVHFHYEPWDMDIALGNRNTGGIAFDPPITRLTMMDENTAAISGRARIDTNNDDIADTWVSNWLFDALEAWDYFMDTIVKQTADALYSAGLTYADSIQMFDHNYQDAWCERIYNYSGNYKYVVNRQNTDDYGRITEGYNDTWLDWLQGARTTHRHWWLKSSMDYYDAKWGVGEFTKKRVYLACEMHSRNGTINIMPTADTYFSFTRERDKYGPFEATALAGLQFSVADINSGAKVPFYINGANFIKELDISIVADGLQTIQLDNAYSEDVGPIITKLNMGTRMSLETSTLLQGQRNGKSVNFTPGKALNAIEELNVRGQSGRLSLAFLQNTRTIKKLYGAGAGFTSLASAEGTVYDVLELPSGLTSIAFNSTSWDVNGLSFWTTIPGGERQVTYTYDEPQYDEETGEYYTEETVTEYLQSEYHKYTLPGVTQKASQVSTPIPRELTDVRFTGTTASNQCCRQFLNDWIYSIIDQCTYDWQDNQSEYYENAHEYNTLDEYIEATFRTKKLCIQNIYWDNISITGLSYDELKYLSMFNDIDYENGDFSVNHPNVENFKKGYVVCTQSGGFSGLEASQLSTWFGDGVFILNSGGLVIDNTEDVTTLVIGPSAYVDNGEVYLKEGYTARLNSIRFKLQPTQSQQTFSFRTGQDGATSIGTTFVWPIGSNNVSAKIKENLSEDGEYSYYLETYPNITGQAYDVVIGAGNTIQTVHIIPPEYPDEMQLGVEIYSDMGEGRSGHATDPKAENYTTTTINYYKKIGCYTASASGDSSLVVGLQFKKNNKWFYDAIGQEFKDSSGYLSNGYVKFSVYKNGELTEAFNKPIDYTQFISGGSREANNIDGVYLQYYTGFNSLGTQYKYFIPLTVNLEPPIPIIYTISAEVKIGGMVKVITQDIVVGSKEVIAEEGTVLWGIINSAYEDTYGEPFDGGNFTKAVGVCIRGKLDTSSKYYIGETQYDVSSQRTNITSLVYGGKSILYNLPNITKIELYGLTNLTNQSNEIDNIDLTNITKLTHFSLYNSSQLSLTVDLSQNENITEIDLRGTTSTVILPQNSIVTSIKYGSPYSIIIDSPVHLTYNSVSVSSKSNLTNVTLKNIYQNKTYQMFYNLCNGVTLTSLTLQQSGSQETVPTKLITALYDIANTMSNDNISLSGSIYVQNGFKNEVNYLNDRFNPEFMVNAGGYYTKLEHISSTTSGQYINLQVSPSSSFNIATKFKINGEGAGDGPGTFFSTQNTVEADYPGTFIRISDGNVQGRYIGGSSKNNTLGSVGSTIELSSSNQNVNSSATSSGWPTTLFCATGKSWSGQYTQIRFVAATLYYFKMWVSGTLVRDLIPCKDGSSQVGMYDMVDGKFYGSSSNASFVAGPELVDPIGEDTGGEDD